MGNYKPINILDMITAIGEGELEIILSDFSCPKNKGIESFIRTNAIEFAKRKISITYLVVDEDGRIVGIFTLTHKAIQLCNGILSKSMRKRVERYARLDEETDSYMLSAFLIAQFSKNYQYPDAMFLSGNELMDMTMFVLKNVQKEIGGGAVYLECDEDNINALNFYQNETNHFIRFGDRFSENDNIRYIQLIRIF